MENLPFLHNGKRAAVCQVVGDRKAQGAQTPEQGLAVSHGQKFCAEGAEGQGNLVCPGENEMDSQRVGEVDDPARTKVGQ